MADEVWNVQSVLTHLTLMLQQHKAEIGGLLEAADQRYAERDKAAKEAVAAALAAQEKATAAAFAAAEKANDKTAVAMSEFKTANNEHRGTLKDVLATMPTRRDLQAVDDKIDLQGKMIAELREARASGAGRQAANDRSGDRVHDTTKWIIGLIATIILFTIAQILLSQR